MCDSNWPIPISGIAHAMALGLGPWMAVEIPDLIEKVKLTFIKPVLNLVHLFSGCDHLQGEGRGGKQLNLAPFASLL